jgi:hypothetical protein
MFSSQYNDIHKLTDRLDVTAVRSTRANYCRSLLSFLNSPPPPTLRFTSLQENAVHPDDYIYGSTELYASPVVLEHFKLIFFIVPGVADDIWKRLFRRMMGYNDWIKGNGQLTYLSDYNTSTASKLLHSPEYTKAMIIRDPKDRILSIFLDYIVGNNQRTQFLKSSCCQFNTSCAEEASYFRGFVKLIQRCPHPYWRPQGQQMEPRYYRILDFVGKFENSSGAGSDAQRLMERIHAWEDFGKTGWGPTGSQSILEIFDQEYKRVHGVLKTYTSGIRVEVDWLVYNSDFVNEKLNLTRSVLFPFL